MNIVVAADPFAVTLKDSIKSFLVAEGHVVEDVGTSGDRKVDYYKAASRACEVIQQGKAERGILFCGSGAGMAIVAGKHSGIVAVAVESVFAARMCRAINDANVLCMGAMIWGEWMAREAVKTFLATAHTEGLDDLKDFLRQAVGEVREIDERTEARLRLNTHARLVSMRKSEREVHRLAEVARMYYDEELTQADIAKAFGVSRALVSNLLRRAKELGIVSIRDTVPFQR